MVSTWRKKKRKTRISCMQELTGMGENGIKNMGWIGWSDGGSKIIFGTQGAETPILCK